MWIQRLVHSGASGSITDSQNTNSKKKKKATQIRILGLDAMEKLQKRKSGFKGRETRERKQRDENGDIEYIIKPHDDTSMDDSFKHFL